MLGMVVKVEVKVVSGEKFDTLSAQAPRENPRFAGCDSHTAGPPIMQGVNLQTPKTGPTRSPG